MSATQKYRNCTPHNGRFTFQLSVLGFPCRTSEHWSEALDAAISCDVTKHYLREVFKLDLPASLDGEAFSGYAYSRLGVILSDSASVLKAIPEDVREFILLHTPALSAHRDSQPPEPDYAKWSRHAQSMERPEMREWVRACEQADVDARAFKEIDHDSFSLRLRTIQKSFDTALKSAALALRMHADVTNEKLISRRTEIEALIAHLETDRQYIEEFSARLAQQQTDVASALSKLERPPLT